MVKTEEGIPFKYRGKIGIEFFDKNENLTARIEGMSKQKVLQLSENLIRAVNNDTREYC